MGNKEEKVCSLEGVEWGVPMLPRELPGPVDIFICQGSRSATGFLSEDEREAKFPFGIRSGRVEPRRRTI